MAKAPKPLYPDHGILKNAKHEAFCQLVALHDERPAVAYAAVGYKCGTKASADTMSSLLMDRPDITERIRQLRVAKLAVQTQAVASSGINKQWVLDSLVKVAKRCMQEEPVLDSEGNATGEFKFDSAGATKALGLVGKELGMFVDRKDVTVRQIDQMSRAEIDAELAELERAARISASRSGRQDREGLH